MNKYKLPLLREFLEARVLNDQDVDEELKVIVESLYNELSYFMTGRGYPGYANIFEEELFNEDEIF